MPVLPTDGVVEAHTGEWSFLKDSSGIEPRWVGGLFLGHFLRTARYAWVGGVGGTLKEEQHKIQNESEHFF